MLLNRNIKPFIGFYAILITISFIFSEKIIILDKLIHETLVGLQTPILISIFTSITFLGSLIFWGLIISMIWINRDRKTATYLFIGLILDTFLNGILKFSIGRTRPETTAMTEVGPSFPSAHTSRSFMGAFLVNYHKEFLITLAVLVGFSRMYLGVHYLSDVIFGAMNGIMLSMLVFMIPEKRVERFLLKISKIF